MTQLNALEQSLVKANKDLPSLPKGFKDFIVQIAPWLTLLGGILSILAAYSLYKWATVADGMADYANSISRLYGGTDVVVDRMGPMIWVSLAALALMGVIYLMAFKGLKDMKKSGWDLLFLASLINLVYVIVSQFTDYAGFGSNLITGLLGTAITWYFLFQIRDYFTGTAKVDTPKVEASKKA